MTVTATGTRRAWRDRSIATAILVLVLCVHAQADETSNRSERQDGVRVEGVVTYDGPIPDPVPVPEAALKRPLVEVDAETGGLRDSVVWLEGVPQPSRSGDEPPDEPVVMDQQNYFFIPHVLAIEEGQEVEFLNSDIANHGVTASSLRESNRFNVTTPPGGSDTHRFEATRRPVSIGCPIHASMAAWIYVFDHPYHAVTDDRGRFRLPPVPPGRYTLWAEHADGGMRQRREVVVREGEPLQLRIEFLEGDLDDRLRADAASSP